MRVFNFDKGLQDTQIVKICQKQLDSAFIEAYARQIDELFCNQRFISGINKIIEEYGIDSICGRGYSSKEFRKWQMSSLAAQIYVNLNPRLFEPYAYIYNSSNNKRQASLSLFYAIISKQYGS